MLIFWLQYICKMLTIGETRWRVFRNSVLCLQLRKIKSFKKGSAWCQKKKKKMSPRNNPSDYRKGLQFPTLHLTTINTVRVSVTRHDQITPHLELSHSPPSFLHSHLSHKHSNNWWHLPFWGSPVTSCLPQHWRMYKLKETRQPDGRGMESLYPSEPWLCPWFTGQVLQPFSKAGIVKVAAFALKC